MADNARLFVNEILECVAGKDLAEEVQSKITARQVDSIEPLMKTLVYVLLKLFRSYRHRTKNPDVTGDMQGA